VSKFVNTTFDPNDPDSMLAWSKEVSDIINGHVSFGEPESTDWTTPAANNPLLPNGVKGHFNSSFVVRGDIVATDTRYDFVHNLNVPNKSAANMPLNVYWIVVRLCHDGNGVVAGDETITCNYDSNDAASVSEISFPLRFYTGGARNIAAPHPLTVAILFFPATR